MEIKDVQLNLKIRNNKVSKILEFLLTEAVADFQRNHPKRLPALFNALKRGDTEDVLKRLDGFIEIIDDLKESVESVQEQAIKSLPPIYKNEVTGETTFINPDGNVVQKMSNKGSLAVVAGPDKKSLKDMGKEEE